MSQKMGMRRICTRGLSTIFSVNHILCELTIHTIHLHPHICVSEHVWCGWCVCRFVGRKLAKMILVHPKYEINLVAIELLYCDLIAIAIMYNLFLNVQLLLLISLFQFWFSYSILLFLFQLLLLKMKAISIDRST